MKTSNIKKQVGYLIRMDEKNSWIQQQLKLMPNYVNNGPLYIHLPEDFGVGSKSIRLGWKHRSDAMLALDKHLKDNQKNGIDLEKRYDLKIVKVTVIEED